jgi:site-specific DNA-methyltransferase (adenine-specific)
MNEKILNTVIQGDALENISQVADHSIKTIICDPPYFTGMTHNAKEKASISDLAICSPFYRQLFREFLRVLTPDGCLYWFCDWRSQGFYLQQMRQENVPVKNTIVWDKKSGPGNFYTNMHEFILFSTLDTQFRRKGCKNIISEIPAFCSGAKATDGEMVHPAQKPVELISRLITDSTAEGDTVMDCFAGSGTTAVAAIRTKRNFICMELQDKYVDIAKQRIEEESDRRNNHD